jgi:hypothetical protein
VGNDGEQIVADSSTSTGLRYTAGTVQANPVLNSAYQVWQRGTSFAFNNSAAYVADRWYCSIANTGATVSRQTTSDTTNLPFIQYCARLARNSATTNTSGIQITQSFETVNSLPFAGKTVTMSFYARAGANFSSSGSSINVYLLTGTGTDQNQSTGYTGQATPVSTTATLTTTWQRFSFTGTIATTATEIAVNTGYAPVGTAGANDYYEITGWQLDIGSVALPFRTYAATIQGELAACQRYYEKSYNTDVAPATTTDVGAIGMFQDASTSTLNQGQIFYKVAKRGTPTLTIYSPVGGATGVVYNNKTGANVAATALYNGATNGSFYTNVGTAGTGLNAKYHYVAELEL